MSQKERRTENLLRAVRSTSKEAVWLTTSHQPGDVNDVALFATRRGGSTWLMHVIAAAPGFRSLDQPFSVMTANLTPGHYRRVPKYAYGEIVCPAPEELRGHCCIKPGSTEGLGWWVWARPPKRPPELGCS